MKKLLFTALVCLLILFTWILVGCDSEVRVDKEYSFLECKADQMSVESLRAELLNLIDDLEKDNEAMAHAFSEISPANSPFTVKTAVKMKKMLSQYPNCESGISLYFDNLMKYFIFYKKLEEKGGDTSGLEL